MGLKGIGAHARYAFEPKDARLEGAGAKTRVATHAKVKVAARPKERRAPIRAVVLIATICIALIAAGSSAWAYTYLKQDLSWYTNNVDASSYTISTAGELHAFSALVNGDAKDSSGNPIPAVSFEGKTVRMATGLNLFGQEFTPIGTDEHPFAGTFEGNAVSRLSITNPASTVNVGFFGVTASTASVTGVRLSQNSLISLTVSDPAQHMDNIGGVVGLSNGRIEDCSSAARLVINHTVVEGLTAIPANNIGGVAGSATQGMSGCNSSGSLEFRSSALVFSDAAGSSVYTIGKNIGGVVGSVNGTLSDSHNSGSMLLLTSGSGGKDRFGVAVESKTVGVGGVAGYADGNVDGCSNSGNILSSTNPNASFDKLGAQDEPKETLSATGGADGCGGVVGLYRAEMGVGSMTGGGGSGSIDPDAPHITLSNCSNTGFIAGLHAVGGVVGVAGNDTLITRSVNGVAGDMSLGFVRTTRWNKAATGGIAGQTYGDVAWSRNHGVIDNTGAAYYTAGIVGMLLDDSAQIRDPEIYSCYNTGIIYGDISVRSGAIVGENNGYIHDNVFLYGSINSSRGMSESELDANSRSSGTDYLGLIKNTTVVYETSRQATEKGGLWIKSGEAIAILNTLAASGEWSNYYLINNSVNKGYPVLNGESATEGVIDLTQVATTITLDKQARYSASYNPAPTLKVSIVVDGRTIELIDGADFRVLPDPEALDENGICKGVTSGAAPYTARIEGIGNYTGSPQTTVSYGIDKGNFAECTVVAKGQVYTGEPQNDPEITMLDARGLPVPAENYSYVINDGKDCIDLSVIGYPVVATANEDGNYEGEARGTYHIVAASLYADCDVVGVYLDQYTAKGELHNKSVWYFDEEESDIYEVKPILDNDGEFQWTEQGLILVEGMQEYVSTDGRVLTRATPLRTDANGQPIYGDLEVDYTGKAIEPQTIAVLFNGEALKSKDLDNPNSVGQYATKYGYYQDDTMRLKPHNTNATQDEGQPEASVIISGRSGDNFSNYVYFDFKILPITISPDNLFVVPGMTTTRNILASGAMPGLVSDQYDDAKERTTNNHAELRYAPDPSAYKADDPSTYRVVDATQWDIVFDHAVNSSDEPLEADGLGYDADSKIYCRLVPTEVCSLLGWISKPLDEPITLYDPNSSGGKKSLLDESIVVVIDEDTAYDPTVVYPNWLPEFHVYDTSRPPTKPGDLGYELVFGGTNAYTSGADYAVAASTSPNVAHYTLPSYNPEANRFEGTFDIVVNGYSTQYKDDDSGAYRKINYSLKPGVLPEATHSFWSNAWSFARSTSSTYRTLPWRQNGWDVEQLSEQLHFVVRLGSSNLYLNDAFTVESIKLDGVPVEKLLEMDKDYELAVRFDSSKTAWFAESLSETYTVQAKMAPLTLNAQTVESYSALGLSIYQSAELTEHEFFYTGKEIVPELVLRDGAGDVVDPSFFRFFMPQPPVGKGIIKEVGEYNNGTAYNDLHVLGDDIHYRGANSASAKLAQEPKVTSPTAPVKVNLRFSIVAADISNTSKIRMVVDEAFFVPNQEATPKVRFYDAVSGEEMNYLEGPSGDYTLSYRNNANSGTGTVIITTTGNGNLVAQTELEGGKHIYELPFTIQGTGVPATEVVWDYAQTIVVNDDSTLSEPGILGSYQGVAIAQDAYEVTTGTWDGTDFTVKADSWSSGASVWYQIIGKNDGRCDGTVIKGPVTATEADSTNSFSLGFAPQVEIAPSIYTGKAATPVATIEGLVLGRDFKVSSTSVNAGVNAAQATVTGLGAYAGSKDYSFTIAPASVSELVVAVSPQPFTGSKICPGDLNITSVKLGDVELLDTNDWSVDATPTSYGPNINVADGGTLTMIPGTSGNLAITDAPLVVPFSIAPAPLEYLQLDITTQDASYTGAPVELAQDVITVHDKARSIDLSYGSDFVIAGYANNVNVGTATVYLKGAGNYAPDKTVTATFNIIPITFDASMVSDVQDAYEYNGTSVQPMPTIKLGDTPLPASDYAVEYGTNNTIGLKTGFLTITPTGENVTGDALRYDFDIRADISKAQIEVIPNATFERGGSYEPELEIAFNGYELISGVHYEASYASYGGGEKTLTITGKEDAGVFGSRTVGYSILGKPLSVDMATAPEQQDYIGGALEPSVVLSDGSYYLVEGKDYTLSYLNNVNATNDSSKAIVTISGNGDYAGILTVPFEIAARELKQEDAEVQVTASGLYAGTGAVSVEVALYDKGITVPPQTDAYQLVEGLDYTLDCVGNDAVGNAQATIKGTGNYHFEFVRTFEVKGALASARIEPLPTQVWTGTELKPKLAVSLGGVTLIEGRDYAVSYVNNINAGKATVTLTGLGLYEGTTATAFIIEKQKVAEPNKPEDKGSGTSGGTGTTSNVYNTYNSYNSYGAAGSTSAAATPSVVEPAIEDTSDNKPADTSTGSERNTGTTNGSVTSDTTRNSDDSATPLAASTEETPVNLTVYIIVALLIMAALIGAVVHLYLRNRKLTDDLRMRQ